MSGIDEQFQINKISRCLKCEDENDQVVFYVLRYGVTDVAYLDIKKNEKICFMEKIRKEVHFVFISRTNKPNVEDYTIDGVEEITCDRNHLVSNETFDYIMAFCKSEIQQGLVRWE